jgi:hypothetical protein
MAQKNYRFDKRQRELAQQKKKEEKRLKKEARKAAAAGEGEAPPAPEQPGESGQG